jgi:hypothetical protein
MAKEETVPQGQIIREESERPGAGPGEKTWWLHYRFPIHRKGKLPLIGGISVDVTEVHRTKEELENRSRRPERT